MNHPSSNYGTLFKRKSAKSLTTSIITLIVLLDFELKTEIVQINHFKALNKTTNFPFSSDNPESHFNENSARKQRYKNFSPL